MSKYNLCKNITFVVFSYTGCDSYNQFTFADIFVKINQTIVLTVKTKLSSDSQSS